MPPVRRALMFDTPSRTTKRRRTTMSRRSKPMRIPKSLLPEMKQYIRPTLNSASGSISGSSIMTDMTQGDSAVEFIGSKIHAKRLRVIYDYTGLTPTKAIRILVYIPKRASTSVTSVPANTTTPIDTHVYTVLFERWVNVDSSVKAGTFDVPMNLQIESDSAGGVVYRNDLRIGVYALSLGTSVQVTTGYALWYTDN